MTPYYSRIYNLAIRKVFYRLTSTSNQVHEKLNSRKKIEIIHLKIGYVLKVLIVIK